MSPETPSVHRARLVTLVIIAAVLVLFGCLVTGAVSLVLPASTEQQVAAIHARYPAFNLEDTAPRVDTAALEATQEALLSGYGWIDQQAGIARIPIERAMELIVQASTPTPAS